MAQDLRRINKDKRPFRRGRRGATLAEIVGLW